MDIINRLPQELVKAVLSYVEVDDIIRLAINPIASNEVKRIIIDILSSSLICINNRIKNITHLGMYILTKSYIKKSRMRLLFDFKLLFELFQFNKLMGYPLESEITISYYIWDLVDFNQLLNMIMRLGDYHNITFNIELEFDSAVLAVIDINLFFEMLHHSRLINSITGLMVTHYILKFDFDIRAFPRLKRLWLINSNIKFVYPLDGCDSQLSNLHIHPNLFGYNRNKPITIESLPFSLESLSLSNVILKPFRQFPTKMKFIKLKAVKDTTSGEVIHNLIMANMESKSLNRLVINNLQNLSDTHNRSISHSIKQYLPNLIELSISFFPFQEFQLPTDEATPTDDTKIISLRFSRSPFENFKYLFKDLVKLDITDNNLKSFSGISLNQTLKELYISYNPIDWEQSIEFPPNLVRLELRNTELKNHLFELKLPDCIKILGIEVNDITSVDHFRFPKCLTNLGLGSNKIKAIKHHYFPPNLSILHLTENSICEPINFKTNMDNQQMNLISLYINSNKLSSIEGFQFPDSICEINFDDNILKSIKSIEFPPQLVELNFVGCEIQEFENIVSPGLKLINLSYNNLKNFKTKLPQSLEQIILNFNKFEKFDVNYFKSFTTLKHLSISNNRLKIAKFNFPETLTNLNLSNNSLIQLQLSFEKNSLNSTNLMSVTLSGNKLKTINKQMLGDVAPVQHHNLIELDVSDNKIQESEINVQEFPRTLQALIVGYTGKQDRFGYEIGKNIIPHSLCKGKRIES